MANERLKATSNDSRDSVLQVRVLPDEGVSDNFSSLKGFESVVGLNPAIPDDCGASGSPIVSDVVEISWVSIGVAVVEIPWVSIGVAVKLAREFLTGSCSRVVESSVSEQVRISFTEWTEVGAEGAGRSGGFDG